MDFIDQFLLWPEVDKKTKESDKITYLKIRHKSSLSPARWHSKNTYLSCNGMLGTTEPFAFLCNNHYFEIQT